MGTDPGGLRKFWYSVYCPKLPEMVKVLDERAQPPFPSAAESAAGEPATLIAWWQTDGGPISDIRAPVRR